MRCALLQVRKVINRNSYVNTNYLFPVKSKSQTRYLLIEASDCSGADIHYATFVLSFHRVPELQL